MPEAEIHPQTMMQRRLVKAERGLVSEHPQFSGVRLYVHLARHGHAYYLPDKPGLNETGVSVVTGDAIRLGRQIVGSHLERPNQVTFVQYLSSQVPRAKQSAELHLSEVRGMVQTHPDPAVSKNIIVVPDPVNFEDLRLVPIGPVAYRFWEAGHPLFAGLKKEDLKNELLLRQKAGEFPGLQYVFVTEGEKILDPGTRPSDVFKQIQGVVGGIVGHVQHSVGWRYAPEAPKLNVHIIVESHEGLIAAIHALDNRHTNIDSGSRATLRYDLKPNRQGLLMLDPNATMGFNRVKKNFHVSKLLGSNGYAALLEKTRLEAPFRRGK